MPLPGPKYTHLGHHTGQELLRPMPNKAVPCIHQPSRLEQPTTNHGGYRISTAQDLAITPLQSTYQRKRRRHDPEKNKISPNEPTNVKLYIGILSGQIIGDRSRPLDPTPVFHSCPVPAKGLTIPRLSEPRLQAVIWHNYVGDRPSEVSGGTH